MVYNLYYFFKVFLFAFCIFILIQYLPMVAAIEGKGEGYTKKANLTSHVHTVYHQSIKNKACNSTNLYKSGEK